MTKPQTPELPKEEPRDRSWLHVSWANPPAPGKRRLIAFICIPTTGLQPNFEDVALSLWQREFLEARLDFRKSYRLYFTTVEPTAEEKQKAVFAKEFFAVAWDDLPPVTEPPSSALAVLPADDVRRGSLTFKAMTTYQDVLHVCQRALRLLDCRELEHTVPTKKTAADDLIPTYEELQRQKVPSIWVIAYSSPGMDRIPPGKRIFVHPVEIWDQKDCAKMAKATFRDGTGTPYPFKGYIGGSQLHNGGYGEVYYNGGCMRNGEHYDGDLRPFPQIHEDYEIVHVPTWGYRIKLKSEE